MSEAFVVVLGDDAWRVGRIADGEVELVDLPHEAGSPVEARVDRAAEQLEALGHAGQPVVLALPSAWCLSAVIAMDDLERSGRRRAMGYRLEECLPISCEDVVADYVEFDKGEALGVCAEYAPLAACVNAFEARGVPVGHLCPAAVLVAAHEAERCADIDGVLIGHAHEPHAEYDLIEFRNGKPSRWWWITRDDHAVREHVAAWASADERPLRLSTVGGDRSVGEYVSAIAQVSLESGDADATQAAARQAARLLDHAAAPWVDLRRDALAAPGRFRAYHKPVGLLAVAVVLLLVSLSVVAQWRGRQYRALAAQHKHDQRLVFQQAMPDAKRVPVEFMARRLDSERRKLAGVGGKATEDVDPAELHPTSALAHLRGVLAHLPGDVRYRVLDLQIRPDLVRVDGEAQSHVEAERVAVALRQSGAYTVEQPKTERLKGRGVSFLFHARPAEASLAAKGDTR